MIKKLGFLFLLLLIPSSASAANFLAEKGSLVKFQTDSRVFFVSNEQGGLEWVQTEAEFKKRGFQFSQVKTLSDAELSNYNFLAAAPVDEPQTVTPSVTNKDGALVVVIDDGTVVANEGADQIWSLASISKLMTAIVLNEMNLNWNAAVVQSKADEVGGSRLRVAVGSKYRRTDLLHASLMGSANNSTHALARTSGITMPQFIARMNAKAKQLGMKNTRFVEPTGLSEKNVSTARDIAILVEAANKIPRISAIGKKNSYTLTSVAKKPKTHTIKTTNKLLLAGENVSLGKTGFIDESRYNFTVVGQSPAGGSRTVVVLNAPSSETSFKLAKAYLHLEK
jgi:D-alanyl-D-alanine endopeptidase (penicillin-binding protein 7)